MNSIEIAKIVLHRVGLWAGNKEDLDGDLAQLVFDLEIDLLERWRLEGITVDYLTRNLLALAADTPSYAIGSGATWDVARPDYIDSMAFINSSGNEVPMYGPLTNAQYIAIPDKERTGQPDRFYYKKTQATGTVYPFPVYDQTGSVAVYTPSPLAVPSTLQATMLLATGQRGAIADNLEIALRDARGKTVSDRLERRALKGVQLLKQGNRQPPPQMATAPYIDPNSCGAASISESDFISRNF